MTETSIYEYAKSSNTASIFKPAFWFYGRSMSRADFYAYVDYVANNLYRLGVRQSKVVTIHLPTCPQAIIAFYAVAKLGGICNMVHPLLPLAGLQRSLAFTESAFLLTGSHFAQIDLLEFSGHVIYAKLHEQMGFPYNCLNGIREKSTLPPDVIPFRQLLRPCDTTAVCPAPADLADTCVCFLNSSGSSSAPKTIMHSHMALNNWVENAKSFFRGEPLNNDTVLSVLPMFHGSGLVMNIHQVLSCGGTQVLMAKWDPQLAISFINKYKITVLTGVPALYQSLLSQKSFYGKKINSITQCFVSGDHVPLRLKEAFNERLGKETLFEGYGMTEIVTACFSNSKYLNNIYSSGYPLKNSRIAIIDSHGNLQNVGQGELVVSTNTMMLGYFKAPLETSSAFFEAEGCRWYKTGDVGRIDEEGFVYFLERTQNIIVRKGYNIYPAEIEEIIKMHEAVDEACVVGIMDPAMDRETESIRACVVLRKGSMTETIEPELRSLCNAYLPKYATGIEFRFFDKLPRNQVSKIDRFYLRQLQ